MRAPLILGATLLSLTACASSGPSTRTGPQAGPPATRTVDVTDTYHGDVVADPYRWLEDWAQPEVRAWSDAQNVWARSHLDRLPRVEAIREQVRGLLEAPVTTYWALHEAGGHLFAKKRQPPRQQPFLVVRDGTGADAAERVLVDPAALDPEGGTSIDWYVPSPDGKLVAVSLSKGGSESGDVHFYDVATGQSVHEVIPRVNGGTAGGWIAWDPDGKGVFYTRYPRPGERPEADLMFWVQVWHHTLGAPVAEDRYELGEGQPRIAEYRLAMDQGSGRLLVTIQDGDGGEFGHHLREADGTWRQFSTFGDKTLAAVFGPDEDLLVLTRARAPRGRIVRVPLKDLDVARGETVVAESEATIVEDFWGPDTMVVASDKLFVLYQLGGPSEVRAFSLDGTPAAGPTLPPVVATSGLTPLSDGSILLATRSYTRPTTWWRYDVTLDETTRVSLSSEAPADFSDLRVVRETATSKDGTRVPVNIVLPPGAEAGGARACVLYGYGGYGVNLVPRFRVTHRVLYDAGVIYAAANLRGGGEFGEAWHRQGSLTNKQNVFDDFHAVLGHLVERGYCARDRVAILGGSNGGLLMGATMTQHPEAAAAVVSLVGIYDMLRVELSANGAFNIPEFGTVADPEQYRALRAYSPYHAVRPSTDYPPTLFLTGANDPRVDPMQSRKMTAALQAATDRPVLLRTSADSGHGGDTALDERVAQWVDIYAFLLHHLGVSTTP